MSKEILSTNGEKLGEITLEKSVFGVEPNLHVMHLALRRQLNNARQGNACAKTRAEVAGGGRKPWKQKGTGNARQGSIRATQWRGGGIVFGPTPNKNYKKKQNKKERRLAVLSALSYKNLDKELIILENLSFEDNKTKNMINLLDNLKIRNNKVLVVVDELTENVCLACRNLPNVKLVTFEEVNAFDTVNADNMLITESALNKLEEVLTRE